jgi:hypothetical protein
LSRLNNIYQSLGRAYLVRGRYSINLPWSYLSSSLTLCSTEFPKLTTMGGWWSPQLILFKGPTLGWGFVEPFKGSTLPSARDLFCLLLIGKANMDGTGWLLKGQRDSELWQMGSQPQTASISSLLKL